jgi:hypothetical protein
MNVLDRQSTEIPPSAFKAKARTEVFGSHFICKKPKDAMLDPFI